MNHKLFKLVELGFISREELDLFYKEAFLKGRDVGYREGRTDGNMEGYRDGRNEGYGEGYKAAVAQGYRDKPCVYPGY